ncbi:MAG: tetratricopeptide repeat protein [Bacteroidia bacterium]|nr:tetratricopeptide repeat protein [Bacteroidia bacterium]
MENKLNKIFAQSECPSQEALFRYHEGTLSSEDKISMEHHLASCELCSDELEGMAILNQHKINIAVEELKTNIRQKLGKQNFFSFNTYLKIAAVITVLVVISVVLYMTNFSDQTLNKKLITQNTEIKKTEDSIPKEEKAKAEPSKDAASEKLPVRGLLRTQQEKEMMEKKDKGVVTGKTNAQSGVKLGASSRAEEMVVADNMAVLRESKEEERQKINKKADRKLAEDKNKEGWSVGYANGAGAAKEKEVSKTIVAQTANTEMLPKNQNENQKDFKKNDEGKKSGEAIDNLSKDAKVTSDVYAGNVADESLPTIQAGGKDDAENKKSKKVQEPKGKEKADTKVLAKVEAEKESSLKKEETTLRLPLRQVQGDGSGQEKDEKSNNTTKTTTADHFAQNTVMESTVSDKKKKDKPHRNKNKSAAFETTDGALPGPVELLSTALRQFNSGKYDESISLFEKVLEKEPANYKALYYSGLAYYNIDKPKKAIKNFETLLKNNVAEYADDAKWYLALSHIKKKDMEEARRQLNEISTKGGKRKADADKKLEEIK